VENYFQVSDALSNITKYVTSAVCLGRL